MKIAPARKAAFDILLRIEKDKAYSSALLASHEKDLLAADRALCHELVLGTLRRQISLDHEIDVFANKKTLDIEVRVAIRLGLYQVRFLTRVPEYSAINESVNLVQRARKTSAKSLVNAVLRKSTRENIDFVFRDYIERISVEQSHPRWLIEKWSAQFGPDEAEKLAIADNIAPQVAFRVIGTATEGAKDLVAEATRSDWVNACYIATDESSTIFELAERGEIYVQDEASQLTAHAVCAGDGERVLDVCAAPGGKTGLIAQMSSARLVVAGDIHLSRVKFLRENCLRQNVKVPVMQYDAETGLPFADGAFDTVLVDAPCSGTGTIRHNPEIRYRIEPRDFPALQAKQLKILINASKLLKKGGLLVYSTCSVEREENEDVCERFEEGNPDFQKVAPNVSSRFVTADGYARTWPHRDNMDGFFVAAFRRN